MNTKNILLIDTVHPSFKKGIEELGYSFTDGTTWSNDKILEELHNYTGILVRSKITLDKNFFDKAPNLKFIARAGAGIEHIDIEEAKKRNIAIITAPEGNRDSVGEHSIGMLLSLTNNLSKADKEIREGKWIREDNRGYEIQGKTVGIIGYGYMGSAFAQRLSGFDCKVIAYDKYKKNFSDKLVIEVSLQTLFDETDILSLHIPLTEETNYMVNDGFINLFAKSIFIINTSRGKIINTKDLVKSIKTAKIRGAALDVLEYENQSFESKGEITDKETYDYLINSNKVILTPHIAGWTFESYKKIAEVLVAKIAKLNL
jgi:D-3-phosphoglycerate dehydrogenase